MTKHLHLKPRLLALIVALSMGASGTGLFAQNISFADEIVRSLCYANWDTNHDNALSIEEAAAVTSLGTVFKNNTTIEKFRELENFTGLTTIDASAFEGCTKLQRVGIPSSVTTIGSDAFKNCTAMARVYVQSIDQWCGISFANAAANPCNPTTEFYVHNGNSFSQVISLTIPEGVTTIGNYAFYGRTGFTGDLAIPNTVTTIGEYAFYGCTGFTGNLTIGNAVTTIGQHAFENCTGFTGSMSLGSSVTSIGQFAFNGCTGFTGELEIPNSVITIGKAAFKDCRGFTGDLIIPNSVITIEGGANNEGAFGDCSGLTGSLTIGNSVTTIGMSAFRKCGFTGNLTIGNSLTTIGPLAFAYCAFTGDLVIPNSVTTIGNGAFRYCGDFTGNLILGNSLTSIGNYAFQGCSGFTGNLILPNSLTTIGYEAFEDCSGFTGDLAIPNSVTSDIGNETFMNCSSFNGSLIIGNSVTNIHSNAFQNCTGFTGCLTIGRSVNHIYYDAFNGLSQLCMIIVDVTAPPAVNIRAFEGVPTNIRIYVPRGTITAYQAADEWSVFTNNYYEHYDFVYDEPEDIDWSNDDNWIPEKPTSDDVVVCITTDCHLDEDVNVLHLWVRDNADVLTINSGKTLTTTYGVDTKKSSQLIIAEGGQVVTKYATKGTVQKHIDAFSSANDGWSFIASPVTESLTASTVDGLIPSGETVYDLYYLDEENTYWRNYKQNAFELNHNQGYLYANQAGTDINFSGIMQPYVAEGVSIPLTKAGEGWNLVGNPFTFNAYANKPYYVINGRNVEAAASGAIAPCTGIVVKAEGTPNETVKFTKDAPVTSSAPNHGSLQITLSEANTRSASQIDNAIITFSEGFELGKFYFGEQDANIYLPQNDEDYAIACAAKTGELPLNFKATKNGEYTLSVNPEDVEMEYLHLIDNMTGADIDFLQTSDYTFNAKTTDYASRFRLVFSANSVDENGASTGSEAFAYISNDEIVLTDATADATLQIVDVTGRIVSTHNASTHISINGLTAGVYVLRLINGENVKTQKIVVK